MKRTLQAMLLALVAIMMPIGAWAQEVNGVASVTINGETTYYTSIKEAVAKANESGNATITLLQSTTTSERLDFTKSATLDLNGNTLSCAKYFADDYETMVAVTTDGAKLTIIDSIGGGKLDGTGTTFVLFLGEPWAVGFTYTSSAHISGGTVSGWVRMQSGTSMTVSGGTVENNTSSSTVEMYTETTLNVSGGQILNTYEYGNTRCAIDNGGTVNITGGTVSGYIGVRNSGTANISGDANITGTKYSIRSSDGTLAITGGSYTVGMMFTGGTATISGGTITESTAENAVEVYGSADLTISGGTIGVTSSERYATGVYVHDGGTVKIAGGTITSTAYGVYSDNSGVTISGGSISGGEYDLYSSQSFPVALILNEGKTVGATFPDGITVEGITLAELLATDAATYWGVVDGKNTMLTVADDATSITDKGDITVRAICDHSDSEHTTATDNGDGTHDATCSDCGAVVDGAAHTYDETGFCTACGHFDLNATEVVLTDGALASFCVASDMALETLTYTRTLPNTEWNALYVPFEIEVTEALLADYDVAYANNMHAYDTDENGEIDELEMEVIKIRQGTLHANHPYFIRAKSEAARALTLTVENTTLYATESVAMTCQSFYTTFTLTGIYSAMDADDFAALDGTHYAIATEGGWWRTEVLNPFRVYMTITEREGSPVKVSAEAMARVRIVTRGEETTGIDNGQMTIDNEASGAVYDLQGRKVENPTKGVYIVNGKKVVMK